MVASHASLLLLSYEAHDHVGSLFDRHLAEFDFRYNNRVAKHALLRNRAFEYDAALLSLSSEITSISKRLDIG